MKPYVVEEIVSRNAVKLKLLASIKIYLIVNVSRFGRYRKLVKGQRVKEPKLVKVEKILNKRKVMGVIKYLVY